MLNSCKSISNVVYIFSSVHRAAEFVLSIPSFTTPEHLPVTDYRDPEFLKDFDKYILGKAYFDLKEFKRVAFFSEECKSQKAYFLLVYSHYLVRIHIFVVGYMYILLKLSNFGWVFYIFPQHPLLPI